MMLLFAQRLRELRERNNETQKQLGVVVNKGESTVRMWELGKSSPDPETLKIISSHYDVSVDFLLGIIDMEIPPSNWKDGEDILRLARKLNKLEQKDKTHLNVLIESMLNGANKN